MARGRTRAKRGRSAAAKDHEGWALPRLLEALQEEEQKVRDAEEQIKQIRRALLRHDQAGTLRSIFAPIGRAVGWVAGRGRPEKDEPAAGRRAGGARGGRRKRGDRGPAIIEAMRKLGANRTTMVKVSDVAAEVGLKNSQVSAALQALGATGAVKSNGKRGQGGGWFLLRA